MGKFFVRRLIHSRLFIAIYLVVGLIVAHSHHYFSSDGTTAWVALGRTIAHCSRCSTCG